MAQELIDKIRAAAQAKGIDPEVALGIARAESGLDPNAKAKSSSASGLFQILNSTWAGNKGTPGKQFDENENIRVGTDIISKNVQSLKGFLGRDPSPKEVYAAHYFGATGAQNILSAAPDTPTKQLFSEKVLAANPNLKNKTAAQVLAQLEGKLKISTSNVSRETKQAKTEPTPAEEIMTKALPAGTTASVSRETMMKGMPDIKSMPASYQAAFALAALADAQDEEDDRVYNENKGTETEAFFANYKPVNHLASLDLSVKPLTFKEGGDVDAEDLSKPSFGNPNIKKQGEAARRLAAMRDVNTLPDPKTYAVASGLLGTRPDQMGFSVLNPKYKEIMDVANPAFYAGTALQIIVPVAQGPGMGRMVGAAERALEPAVRRTLEGGGKASEMLQALAAPPSQMFVRARPEAAARHANLQAQGLSPEQIRAQNLTLVDNRGNLLEEISDAPAVLQQKTASVPRNFYDMLAHPELKSIYPGYDMPDVRIGTTRRKNAPLASASFGEREGIQGTVRSLPGDDVRGTVRGTLLHEGQHAIQSIEGFTEGANPSAFVAYIKAKRGIYHSDPTVNENVIREMERAYPNLPEVTDRIGQDLKARYGKVFPSDRRVGEALYRHMPGEVQADLARIRGNLTPEELKATPLETSMQQLNINPANILQMSKSGSRPDRQIGDLEYDVYGYADGGEVDMEGEEIKFSTQQQPKYGSLPVPPPPPATRSAKELDAYIKALNPGAKISYFPEGGGTLGHVSSDAPDVLNIQRKLSPQRDEETKLHELEHSLTFRAGDPLGRPKIKKVDNNYQAYYMLGDWRPMSEFTQNMADNREKLEQFFGRPLNNAYFQQETLASVKKQQGDTSALFDEQLATLSALEQITGKSLTRDPEMKKLFPNTRVMSVFDALTGPRQTRLDARDLPPSTPQPAYVYRDNPVTQFLHKHLLGDNFYPYKKPVRRADGSPEGGEIAPRLTPQQMERIAAQELAEREAASNAAFIAQKSGIGRKAGPVSQALQSGQGQIEFLKGMTNVPQNILGAPMDISNMIANVYGGGVEKPFMGSEYLKEKSRAAGLGFTPSTDPTLAGFYGAGDLGSNLVNPAGVTRAGVQAAGKTGEAAKMLAQDFQQYNQNLAVPGASYAVRNKGTPVAMSGLPFLSNVDEAEFLVKGVIGSGKKPLELTDKSLSDWFSKTVTRYLRSDFATPQDQLVRAAEENKMLHLAPKEFSDSAEDQALKHFLGRRQSDLEYMRQAEGFGKSNMATTPYGQRIEDITDISAYPERVGDLTPNRVPASMRNLVETQPEARVTDFAPNIVENLKLEQLRDKMLDVRQSDGKYGAYGQPAVKIPSEFLLPDDTLAKLNVAAASNRMARYTKWQDETRQKMATTALRADPAFSRAELQEGKFLGVALPNIKKNPQIKQLVTDVGCDGGWCTRYTPNAEAYASGFSRLHVIVTGEGKQARPVAQFAIADSGPSYDTKRFSITEVKEKGNTKDFANNPALPAIQEYIQYLDKTYGGLDYVDDLKGLRMTQLPEYPMQLLDLFNPTVQQRRMLKNKYGSEENGFRAVRDKAVDLNNGSRFMTGNEDAVANSLEQAMQLLVGPKETLARRIQMNLFGLPKEKATGGMIERQPNDNRRYL